MLIHCTTDIEIWNGGQVRKKSGRPLRSCVMTKMLNDEYYVSVLNSSYPKGFDYKVADIEFIHDKFLADSRVGIRFKEPKHLLLIAADDKRMLQMFLRQINDIRAGKKVVIAKRTMPKAVPTKRNVMNRFDPSAIEFTAIERFDNRILNMNNLKKLVLDNCTVPMLPEQLGNLPIEYLDLSNITMLNTEESRLNRGKLWDWMCMDKIGATLKTLKMNKIGMNFLPFELLYLTELEVLSLANNNLEYLPHYLGMMEKMKKLNVSGNQLKYFPDILFTRSYYELDISDNAFITARADLYKCDHIHTYMESRDWKLSLLDNPTVQNLTYLSFYSLFKSRIKYRRQDIPRTLWHFYDVIVRCAYCHEWTLPIKAVVIHNLVTPSAMNLINSRISCNIMLQSAVCQCKETIPT